MINVLAQDPPKMAFRRDQHPVETLPPAAADPALRMGICLRCHQRGQYHLGATGCKDSVKRPGVFAIAIVEQDAEFEPLVIKLPGQVAGLLRHPLPAWLRGAGGRKHSPRPEMHEHQHVQAFQEYGVDAEEVDRHQSLTVSRQKLLPG
jgi:hypothetical protein